MTSAQLNNNKDLEVDLKKEEPSFFGSFFSSAKSQQQKAKKGPQPMEPVFIFSHMSVARGLSVSVNVATPSHSPADRVERARNPRD